MNRVPPSPVEQRGSGGLLLGAGSERSRGYILRAAPFVLPWSGPVQGDAEVGRGVRAVEVSVTIRALLPVDRVTAAAGCASPHPLPPAVLPLAAPNCPGHTRKAEAGSPG